MSHNTPTYLTWHYAWCLTGGGDHLDCKEEDAQIIVRSCTDTGQGFEPSIEVCLTAEKATALGLWLIAVAARIAARYPEEAGEG